MNPVNQAGSVFEISPRHSFSRKNCDGWFFTSVKTLCTRDFWAALSYLCNTYLNGRSNIMHVSKCLASQEQKKSPNLGTVG